MPFSLVSLLSHLLSRCRPFSPLLSAFFDHELRQCRLALLTCAAAVAPIPPPRAWIRAELLDRAPAAAEALIRLALPARATPAASCPPPRLDLSQNAER